MRKLSLWGANLFLAIAGLCMPLTARAVPVTEWLQLWHHAGVENYQDDTGNPGGNIKTYVQNNSIPAANADGDAVGTVLNLAKDPALSMGGGWGAIQRTGGPERPLLRDVNGRPAWELGVFEGEVRSLYTVTTNTWGDGGNEVRNAFVTDTQSWFLAYRPSTLDQTGVIFRTAGAANYATTGVLDIRITPDNGGTLMVGYDPAGGSNFQTLSTTNVSADDFSVLGIVRDGSELNVWHNGAHVGTLDSLASHTSQLHRYRTGTLDGSSSLAFSGYVSSVLGYNAALTDEQRVAVQEFLAVPEPSSFILLTVSAFGFAAIARRRRK